MMNTSYFVLLPVDILRQIPTSYRVWKLLQITSHAIDYRLGDYHINRDRHYIDRYTVELPYQEFIDKLIDSMWSDEDDWTELSLCTECEWDGANDEGYNTLEHCRCMLKWNGKELIVYQDDENTSQILTRCNGYPDYYVKIGNGRYKPRYNHWSIAPLYTVIYNELPELYSKMYIVKRMSLYDTI